jgi:predicted nucleic acid-binding protein
VSTNPSDFLDANILIYAFSNDPRASRAQAFLERGCVISVQVMNEFANVAKRKLHMSWTEIREALSAVRVVCRDVVPMDVETNGDAIRIAERYGYSFYDALIVASALRSDCGVLWSEDMQDGLVIDQRLRIANPFRLTS